MNNPIPFLRRRSVRAFVSVIITYLMLAGQAAPLALAANAPPPPPAIYSTITQQRRPVAPPTPEPPPPVTSVGSPTIVATKIDSWDDSATPDGKAEPGQTITYTVTITNNGTADATGVTFTDSVDTNTTLVPGSVNTQPIAIADTYNVIGNVRIQPNAAQGLLANDRDPDTGNNTGLTASGPTTSTQGGNVSINADGSFSYNPPVGFTGTDTLTYTITDGGGKTDTATATFNVGNGTATPGSNVVWFVNPSAPSGGDGRLTNPFNCYTGVAVSCFSQTAADDPGDTIFLYSGAHTGGNTLLNTQKLVGAGASDTLANIGGLTVQSYSDALPATGGAAPTITTAAASTNAVNLGSGNTLRGFIVGNTTGAKIGANGFGTLTVGNNTTPDVTLNGTGQAIALLNGTFAATSAFSSVTTTSSAGQGILLQSVAGTLAFGSTTVSGSATQGILVSQSTASINFGNTSVGTVSAGTGGTNAVSLQNNSAGTRTFSTLTIKNNNGPSNAAFLSGAGGGTTVAGTTDISGVSGTGAGIDIQSLASGTSVTFGDTVVNKSSSGALVNLGGSSTGNVGGVTFLSLGGTNGAGPGIVGLNNTGTITVTNTSATSLSSTNGAAIDITGASTASRTPLAIKLASVSATNGTNGINLVNVSGTLTTTGGSITGVSGASVNISGSTANITHAGGATKTSAGNIVAVTTQTGGTVALSGAYDCSSSCTGISLTNNTGGTINFTGGMTLSTGANPAFTATGGGTVTATQNNTSIVNTLTTTTGTALNVANTTIGAAGLTFRSISSNGGANGIILNTTGSSGGLTVSGNGGLCDSTHTTASDCTGGTIQAKTARGADLNSTSNVTLKNMYFKGNATTAVACTDDISAGSDAACNSSIHMVSVTTANIDHVYVDGTGSNDMGILGNTVSALTMGTVEVANHTNIAKVPVVLQNLSGTCPFTSLSVHNNTTIHSVFVTQNTGTSNITFTSPILTNNNGTNNPDQIQVDSYTSANVTVTATNVNISSNSINTGNGVSFQANGGSTMNATLSGGTVTGTNGILMQSTGDNTHFTYAVTGLTNIANHNLGSSGITAGKANGAGTATTTGTITNNTITAATCGGGCFGISLGSFGAGGSSSATVTGNDISGVDATAIGGTAGQGSTATTFIIQNNNIHNPALTQPGNTPNTSYAIDIIAGTQSGDAPCLFLNLGDMSSSHNVPANRNLISGSWQSGGNPIEVVEFNNSVFKILNLPSSGSAAAKAWVSASNAGAGTDATQIGTVPFQAGTSCPLMLALGGISSARDLFPLPWDFNDNQLSAVSVSPLVAPASAASGSLSQTQLDAIVSAATQRWAATGLTPAQLATLRAVKFEVTSLSGSYLGEASGDRILVDHNAQGQGWFVDTDPLSDASFTNVASATRRYTDATSAPAGHVDLLTAIEHEMGHRLGLPDTYDARDRDSLMYGYLTVGERRLPLNGQASDAKPGALGGSHFLSLLPQAKRADEKSSTVPPNHNRTPTTAASNDIVSTGSGTPQGKTPSAPVSRPSGPVGLNGAGGTVTVNIGTLAPGDSVTIAFQVVIDNPYTGGPNVSNQGTVSGSNFSNVLTDDPDVAGSNNPTLTPINAAQIKINDAKEPEPTSGTSQMLFTLTSSTPAGASGITVNYATASGGGNPATGGASCDGTNDYITASGTATIPNGSKTVTIPVTICSDANAETDETLLLNISLPSTGTIIDAQATGTITANTAGTFVISEFRTRGSAGANDDFVELYNNTNTPLTVAASDASAGYGVYKMGATCADTPVLVGTIPNGTVIPARGHYLMVGSAYSLANYGGTGAAAGNLTMTSDIEDDRNIAVFSTGNIDNISSANRLDAVGSGTNTGNVCDLMREGTTVAPVGAMNIEYSYFRKECDFVSGVGCMASGNPKDTNNNSADFMFADTQGTFILGVSQHLGAPGPENLASPIRRDDAGVLVPLLDATKSSSAIPNRERDFINAGSSAPNGTLYVRRRIQNTTGATITKMRFRIIEMTTFPSPGVGTADFRLRTSSPVVLSGITDPATCSSTGTPTTVPCQVTAQATVLETPPAQPNGGGYNSTVSVSIPGGLANNASIDVNFALGVVQGGTFRFYIIVEALP